MPHVCTPPMYMSVQACFEARDGMRVQVMPRDLWTVTRTVAELHKVFGSPGVMEACTRTAFRHPDAPSLLVRSYFANFRTLGGWVAWSKSSC